jgi:excisionase family DNA binding protein
MTIADSRVHGAECRGPGRNPAEGPEVPSGKPRPEESFEPFVTKLTVAERMEVEIRTVTRLMRRGVLRYYKVGPMVRFKWSEVESDLRDHFHVSGPPGTNRGPNKIPLTPAPLPTGEGKRGSGGPNLATQYPRRAD